MVKSKIDSSITYIEYKQIDPDDKNYDATLYETILLGVNVLIAIGKPKYTFISKNIEYYPIYLIKNDKVEMQIGIYEVLSNQITTMLDDEGDIDLNKFNPPLLFAYVVKNPSLMGDVNDIEKLKSQLEAEEEEVEIEMEEELEKEEYKPILHEIKEQTEEGAIAEREEYEPREDDPWIRKYMKSNHYDIISNEGKGDCLFATIRDGLSRVGIERSVDDLRKLLSSYATDDVFKNYKILYDTTKEEVNESYTLLKSVVDENKRLKDELEITKDRAKQVEIVKRGNYIKEEYKKNKLRYEIAKSQLKEFEFMKTIKTLDDFKKIILTCEFWADVWAISSLEHALNIKLILLSYENYSSDDFNNVLQCGISENKKILNPDYYIILSYTGNHYELVTYKSRGAMKFNELPYDIKQLVVNKCMENNAGPFYQINDFKRLKGISLEKEVIMDIEELEPEIVEEIKESEILRKKAVEEKINEEPLESIRKIDLWNDDTVFQFYDRSSSKPLPGSGNGEKIGNEGVKTYSALSNIMDWRRKLDDNWKSEFILDSHRWKTVQHYYQGSKFKQNNPEFYIMFSLDSNSDISKKTELAEAAGSKSGKYETSIIRPKHIIIDPTFYTSSKFKDERKNALIAKFTQNEEMKIVLMNTGLAKLMKYIPKKPALTDELLMEVRNEIRNSERK
jgi:hypothetical protein